MAQYAALQRFVCRALYLAVLAFRRFAVCVSEFWGCVPIAFRRYSCVPVPVPVPFRFRSGSVP
eukprot:8364603-Alexandrium_andersonii.AAC.1